VTGKQLESITNARTKVLAASTGGAGGADGAAPCVAVTLFGKQLDIAGMLRAQSGSNDHHLTAVGCMVRALHLRGQPRPADMMGTVGRCTPHTRARARSLPLSLSLSLSALSAN
jgi:hypothetical protein